MTKRHNYQGILVLNTLQKVSSKYLHYRLKVIQTLYFAKIVHFAIISKMEHFGEKCMREMMIP